MGFCIDPQDRERNYCENRERLRRSERGQYLCTYHLEMGAQGVGASGIHTLYVQGQKTKLVFVGWCVMECDRPYPTSATDHCRRARLNLKDNFFSI